MQNKLQELTDKLYNEGLAKGKEEGARILDEARSEAASIVADAKKQAAAIVAGAEKEAAAIADKTSSDVKMASGQALQATRKDIEDVLMGSVIDSAKVLSDTAVLKEAILSVCRSFNASEPVDLEVVLPESLKAEMEPWIAGELASTLKAGVKAGFSKKIAGGFTIGPADGGWHVSLTDETFDSLICEYLRPVTKKLLFG